MNCDELAVELAKLKYHVKILGDTIDYLEYPIESLILHMDWSEGDIDRAHDIFEKYDTMLQTNQEIKWHDFEMELRIEFSIGYQTVKSIINAFYRNHQWTDVCYQYAMSFEPGTPIEFHHITRNKAER